MGGHAALAQTHLPDDLLQASPLSPADQDMVRQYVLKAVGDLKSTDSAMAQAARDTLVDPMLKETSVGFRLFYSEQTLPALDEMLAPGADAQRAQLALAVAGAVATDAAADRLHNALADPRPAVRFGAVRELGVLLGQIDRGRAAMQEDRARATISILAQALSTEKNIFVASELAQALAVPVNTESLQDASLTAMCEGMADQASTRQAQAAESDHAFEEIVVLLRSISDAQKSLIARKIHGRAPEELNRAAGRLATESQKYADRVQVNPALNDDGRTMVDRLQAAAGNLDELATGIDN